jgi:hypothetical protein
MFIGNILIFISLATLFGASDGKTPKQLVDEVNKHLKNLESRRSGFTKWDNIKEHGKKKDEYYDVDFGKGRYLC